MGGGEPAAVRDQLVLADARGLWALRYPQTHPLYVLEREPGEPLVHESSLGTRVHTEAGSARPLVVLASERMDADPGWRLLDSGELLHVDELPAGEHAHDPRATAGAPADDRRSQPDARRPRRDSQP